MKVSILFRQLFIFVSSPRLLVNVSVFLYSFGATVFFNWMRFLPVVSVRNNIFAHAYVTYNHVFVIINDELSSVPHPPPVVPARRLVQKVSVAKKKQRKILLRRRNDPITRRLHADSTPRRSHLRCLLHRHTYSV